MTTSTIVPFLLFFFFFLSSTTFFSTSVAQQDRAPHGLANEDPTSFSPSAYDFFHPTNQNTNAQNPCGGKSCSPLPLAAQVEAYDESRVSGPQIERSRVGAGAVAGIVFGFGFVVVIAMGAYYVLVTRRSKTTPPKSDQPDV